MVVASLVCVGHRAWRAAIVASVQRRSLRLVVAAKLSALAALMAQEDYLSQWRPAPLLDVPIALASAGLDFDRDVRWEDYGYDSLPIEARVSSREARTQRRVRIESTDCARRTAIDDLRARLANDRRYCPSRREVCLACAATLRFETRILVEPSAEPRSAAGQLVARPMLTDSSIAMLMGDALGRELRSARSPRRAWASSREHALELRSSDRAGR